jgi:CHASE3 domain sensor protein
MPDDDRLTEIRDLLVEMRDMQREHQERYERLASESIARQATAVRIQKVALITVAALVPIVAALFLVTR